ncbi:MAG: DUF2520 domain-containing protein [Bacteroidales bacterium]|nr:DUF2520 domain-containing protein [Bacteroidales bacterium]
MNTNNFRRIVIVGTGQLAGHLASSFKIAGYSSVQIIGRDPKKTKLFAQRFNFDFAVSFDDIDSDADLIVLAVSDDSIDEVIAKLPYHKGICVHTSGSKSLDVFGSKFEHFGVFYPLQTFTEGRIINFREIPVLVEANNKYSHDMLISIAKSMSDYVYELNSDERRKLHLSAVFVSNFVNALFTMGNDILNDTKLPFKILKPLIIETMDKAFESGPDNAQTGPAKRGDMGTIQSHLALLSNKPEIATLYSLFSTYINNKYNDKTNEQL